MTEKEKIFEELIKEFEFLKQKNEKIYTNLNLNNVYKIKYLVNSEPHWYEKLRICEQIILDRVQAIEENIRKLKEAKKKGILDNMTLRMIEDAILEIKTATEIKSEITEQNKELLEKTDFNELQNSEIIKESFLAQIAKKITVKMLSLTHSIPEEIIEFISNLPQEDIEKLNSYIQESYSNISLKGRKIKLLPPEEK